MVCRTVDGDEVNLTFHMQLGWCKVFNALNRASRAVMKEVIHTILNILDVQQVAQTRFTQRCKGLTSHMGQRSKSCCHCSGNDQVMSLKVEDERVMEESRRQDINST